VFTNTYWKSCRNNSDMCCMVDMAISVAILMYAVVFEFIAKVCMCLLTGVSKCWRKIVTYVAR
jgi:hypothetical protein